MLGGRTLQVPRFAFTEILRRDERVLVVLEQVRRVILFVERSRLSLDGIGNLGFQKVVHDHFTAFDELAGETFERGRVQVGWREVFRQVFQMRRSETRGWRDIFRVRGHREGRRRGLQEGQRMSDSV